MFSSDFSSIRIWVSRQVLGSIIDSCFELSDKNFSLYSKRTLSRIFFRNSNEIGDLSFLRAFSERQRASESKIQRRHLWKPEWERIFFTNCLCPILTLEQLRLLQYFLSSAYYPRSLLTCLGTNSDKILKSQVFALLSLLSFFSSSEMITTLAVLWQFSKTFPGKFCNSNSFSPPYRLIIVYAGKDYNLHSLKKVFWKGSCSLFSKGLKLLVVVPWLALISLPTVSIQCFNYQRLKKPHIQKEAWLIFQISYKSKLRKRKGSQLGRNWGQWFYY